MREVVVNKKPGRPGYFYPSDSLAPLAAKQSIIFCYYNLFSGRDGDSYCLKPLPLGINNQPCFFYTMYSLPITLAYTQVARQLQEQPMAAQKARQSEVKRKTKETDIALSFALDGTGKVQCASGVPFMDHMLTLFAVHGFFDLAITDFLAILVFLK